MPTQRERERERERERKREREGGRPPALWLLILYVFSPLLDFPYVNWAGQECCSFYLVLTLVLGPSMVLLLWAFPFLVF